MTFKINSQIAIIDIDDKSIKEEGHWPWSRKKIATLVDELKNQGTVVIAFDILFSEQEENIYKILLNQISTKPFYNQSLNDYFSKTARMEDADTKLATSIATIDSVLAITLLPAKVQSNYLPAALSSLQDPTEHLSLINSKGYIAAIPALQKVAKGEGFINIFSDADGIMRHAPIIMQYQHKIYPSLALIASSLYLMQPLSLVTKQYNNEMQLEGVRIGAYVIPTDSSGQILIPFVGTSYSFPYYSASDVLNHHLPKDALLGKIVLVGSSATGLGDLHATAIQNPFPGVEIQANIINGILENKFSEKPLWSLGLNLVLVALLGITSSFIFPYYGARLMGATLILFAPLLLLTNNWIWQHTGFILPWVLQTITVLSIALINMMYGYFFEARRREQLKSIFGQYVPAKHIDEMLKHPSDYGMQGDDREMTVLFADIRNFTSISEKMSAKELVHLLNLYLTPMTEIIFNHRGTIDKYVGDLIMAFWGAPLKDARHITHGIQSALEMQKKLTVLNKELATQNLPEIHIGIGLNTGSMSIGDMGSRFRRNYTVLGDAVNLGSRIESLTKYYGVDIIVSETCFAHQPRFVFRKLDTVQVKGKYTGISIYEVICFKNELTEELEYELKDHELALSHYFKKQWDEAEQKFKNLHEKFPARKLYKIYLERIEQYKVTPPPAEWNGVFVHTIK